MSAAGRFANLAASSRDRPRFGKFDPKPSWRTAQSGRANLEKRTESPNLSRDWRSAREFALSSFPAAVSRRMP